MEYDAVRARLVPRRKVLVGWRPGGTQRVAKVAFDLDTDWLDWIAYREVQSQLAEIEDCFLLTGRPVADEALFPVLWRHITKHADLSLASNVA
jgi:hypothetical protein